jgi:hypothetical protein
VALKPIGYFRSAPSPDITELRRHLKQRLKTSPVLRPHLSNLEQMLKSWDAGGNRENLRPAILCIERTAIRFPTHRSRPYGNLWKQEARAANATIAEIYQLCSGGKGEPGNWNGAEPVRRKLAETQCRSARAQWTCLTSF